MMSPLFGKDIVFRQRMLRFAGFYDGRIDGKRGRRTRAAEELWEKEFIAIRRAHCTGDERTENNIYTLLPRVQRLARLWLVAAIPQAAINRVQVKIICGTRSYAEQDELYTRRPRVTRARGGQSMHNFGLAFDFGIFSLDGKTYYGEHEAYTILGELTDRIKGVEWGGDWTKFRDEPHIQDNTYRSTAAIRKVFESS